MIYIDLHQKIQGNLAGEFIAVPNLINIVAKPEHQGAPHSRKKESAQNRQVKSGHYPRPFQMYPLRQMCQDL